MTSILHGTDLHENEKYFDGNHGVVLNQVWELCRGETQPRDHLRISFKFRQKSLLLAKRQRALWYRQFNFEYN